MKIEYGEFIKFCRGQIGKSIDTIGGRSSYTLVLVNPERIGYKLSTGNIRYNEKVRVQKALDRYEQTRSFKTTEYTGFTRAASYILPLIKLYVNNKK